MKIPNKAYSAIISQGTHRQIVYRPTPDGKHRVLRLPDWLFELIKKERDGAYHNGIHDAQRNIRHAFGFFS